MATRKLLNQVVTWQSPSGASMALCAACEKRLKAAGEWPKDGRGQELCQVHRGRHPGQCQHPEHGQK
jgi:hypothetical protein